jgi:hypothetical protein
MKLRNCLLISVFAFAHAFADPHPGDGDDGGARNKDGSIVTGVLTAVFDPNAGLAGVPIPNNLFYRGTTDLTLNAPTTGLSGTAAALVGQINSLDGFSTIERWTTTFVNNSRAPGAIDPASVVPGQSVRVFQVTAQQFVAVTSIVRELTPGVDYVAVASGNAVAIVPLKPLQEYTSYMAVLTNDINDMDGNDATPDQTYFLSKRRTPWVDASGNSVTTLLDDATARTLEGLRQVTLSMELNAAGAGINPDNIILSWTVQTQSISPTLGALRSIVAPAPVVIGPVAGNTGNLGVGLPGIANFQLGVITLPYFSGIPSAENPLAPLTDFWKAEPGGYVPPFDQFGLDPNSTNLTLANPFPVLTGMQTVPLIISVPNANSGMTRPADGWPVVIFGHGLGGNRVMLLLVADALAAAGFAGVAIDFPLHGVVPQDPVFGPFNIENTPFGPIANERTFNVDYQNNQTGAPGPDGVVDSSGAHALNFQEFRTSRDNVRQGIIDLATLASTVGTMDLDGNGTPDLKGTGLGYAGISWGGINGTGFTAIEPLVDKVFLNVPAGGLVRAGESSPTFGPRIRAGLAQAGIVPGDPLFELYLTVGQSVVDSADPINWVARTSMAKSVLLHEVIGDTVLPNAVPGAPLSGTEAMIRIGALASFSSTQDNLDGLRAAARYVPPATHGSLHSPASSAAATFEMQGQMATFMGSGGTLVNVGNPDTLVPVASSSNVVVLEPGNGDKDKKQKRTGYAEAETRLHEIARPADERVRRQK